MTTTKNNTNESKREKVFKHISGYRYTKWENGCIKEEWHVNDRYKKDGEYKRYDDRHNCLEVRTYLNGTLVSTVTENWQPVAVDRDHSGMSRWLEDAEGNVWHIEGYGGRMDRRVDLANRRTCTIGGEGCPTLQEAIEGGMLTKRQSFEEVDLMYDWEGKDYFDFDKVLAFFRERGYNVTEDALRHNLYAWNDDMKSGYRDDENGYFLFTPCGCNPLRFTLQTIDDNANWQKTYVA